jgi:hypothetical protein
MRLMRSSIYKLARYIVVLYICVNWATADEIPVDSVGVVFPIQIDWLSDRFASIGIESPKGISLVSQDSTSLATVNRHILEVNFPSTREIKLTDITGKNLIFEQKMADRDILPPQGISFSQYYNTKKQYNLRKQFKENNLSDSKEALSERGAGKLELVGADIAGQRVSLRVSGNININGRLQNQKRSQVRTGIREGQSTTFIINQKQQLNIEGSIGDRLNIMVDQDSERDFDFENAMHIVYTGKEDEIIQKIEAGNVSLSLPGTQFVTASSKSSGLFGFKAFMKMGPVDITSIASIQRGKQEKLNVGGGAQETTHSIRDYEYLKGIYFFLDKSFRESFYQGFFDNDRRFLFDPNKVVSDLEIYKSIPFAEAGCIEGVAYIDPNNTASNDTVYIEDRIFRRLELGKDYTANLNLGYIRLSTQAQESEVIAVTYRIVNSGGETIKEYGDWNIWNEVEGDTTEIGEVKLKIIKPLEMTPSHPCWDLEFKNIYFLGATGINEDGFDLKIVYIYGKTGEEERDENGVNFLQKFGLDLKDKNGNLQPDEVIDHTTSVINLQSGELWIPYLRPFQKGSDDIGERNPNLSEKYSCSAMYDVNRTMYNEITEDSKFKIICKYEERGSTINLGGMLIEGSEVVTLDGRTLTQGVDYTVDYFTGTLTLHNQNALNPDANLDVQYEKHQFFQLDKKTMLGTRAQYDFGQNSFVGGTALYFSQSVIDEKVEVGYEPMRNIALDLNGRINEDLPFLTRAIGWLPIVKTDQMSSISVEGEIARVFPNPNTISNESTGDPNGVGFIDDFEGSKRVTSPPIMRHYWSRSSAPLDKNVNQQGFIYWFNPYGGVPTKSIWPNKEVSIRAQNNITEVLIIGFDPEWSISVADGVSTPEEAWGGITYYFPPSYYDQSKAKFLEVWIKGEKGHLHIDLGQISEDQIANGALDTEDQPEGGLPTGNTLLDDGEDTGLDGLFDEDEYIVNSRGEKIGFGDERLKDYKRNPNDPHSDNWSYKEGSTNFEDYRYANGTEGNSKDVTGLYPDTEDRNGNNSLDRINDYYSVDFYLDEQNNKYIAGRTEDEQGRKTGWKLYRIPLSEFQKNNPDGNVAWQAIKACRLWVDGYGLDSEEFISIAKIEMVGNEWEELGVAKDENSEFEKKEGAFSVTVVNTEENEYYVPPKGVQGEYDRINEIRLREQSLVMSIDGPEGLKPGEICAAKKTLLDESKFIMYEKMKLFINGHNIRTRNRSYNEGEETPIRFFLRFGRGGQEPQYYEYRQPVYTGWDKRNQIEIDLDFIVKLKTYNREEDFPGNDQFPKRYKIIRDENGNIIKRIYREVENNQYTGKEFIVYGTPSITRITQLEIGLINQKYALDDFNSNQSQSRYDETVFGEVWVDELRLSGARREGGVAYRSSMQLKLADLGNISINMNRNDADFRDVQEENKNRFKNINSLSTRQNFSIRGGLSLNKFLPSKWGVSVPVSASYTENTNTPKFIPGEDILTGDSAPDSIMNINQQYGFNISFRKARSDYWLTKYTIDQMEVKYSATRKTASDEKIRETSSKNYSGNFSYSIPFGRDNYIQPMKWASDVPLLGNRLSEVKVYYTPSKLSFSMDMSEAYGNKIPRRGESTSSYGLGLNRRFNFEYDILDNFAVSFSKTMKNVMDEFRGDKTRALKEWNAGIPISVVESYSTSYTPKIIPWLTPTFQYSSNYNWGESLTINTASIDQLSNQNRFMTSFNLSLASVIESFYTPKSGKPSTTTGGRYSGTSNQESVEEKESKEIKSLEILYKYLKKVQNIQVSYSVGNSVRSNGRLGNPDILYRMGFKRDPGLTFNADEVPLNNKDIITENVDFSIRSGLNLSNNISIPLSYSQNVTQTLAQGQESKKINRDFFPLGETGKEGFPFPGWSLRLSGLEKISFLSKYFRSISLDHGFSGKEIITYKDGQETQSSYRMYFQPLAGATLQFKNNVSSTVRMTEGKTVTNGPNSTNITNERNISASVNYQKRGGMTISLPFFEDLRLDNTITFSLTADYTSTINRMRQGESEKFTTSDERSSWKIAPRINYSFTDKVTGGVFFTYSESDNRRTGKRVTRDGGFDITIAIRG